MKNIKLLLLLFVSILSLNIYAQTADQLIGKWQFKEIVGEELDEKMIEMSQHLFGGMKLEFKKDGSYETEVMGQTEKGTWELNGLIVNQLSKANKETKMDIKKLTDEELVYDFGASKGGLMKLVKVKRFDLPAKKKPAKVVNVEAKPDQIYGTWYFKEKELSVANDEAAIADAFLIGMFENAYFKYNEDGSYEDDAAFKIVTIGTWKLEKENTVLVVTKKDKPAVYDIIGISENEMKLVSRKLDGAMTFVREKPEREE